MTPAPSPLHQRVSKRLQRMLEAYFEERGLGEVFDSPIDVILTPQDVVQPDLVVVADPQQISGRGIEGPPLLAVEVLVPSTRAYDRTIKAKRYAALGIQHLWLLDPSNSRLECYRKKLTDFELIAEAEGPASFIHPDWPDLPISLTDI